MLSMPRKSSTPSLSVTSSMSDCCFFVRFWETLCIRSHRSDSPRSLSVAGTPLDSLCFR
jgi:hypothetical protein